MCQRGSQVRSLRKCLQAGALHARDATWRTDGLLPLRQHCRHRHQYGRRSSPLLATTTVKLFRNGRSQAVRLPKEFAMRGKEVYVRRVGDLVVLIPKDADVWGSFAQGLEQFTDDFMSEPRTQRAQQQREPVG